HNLRSPLMSVLGLLNISRKEVQNKDYSRLLEYFDMMGASIEKLDNTLKEIVDYSKNARVDVKIEKIDLQEVLENCIDKLNYLEGAKEIKKEIIIDGGNIIFCDPDRLKVIFINIISNAIKYRDANKENKKLCVTVRSYPYKTSISIKDNGIGIFPNYVDKVFDMFYRASDKSNGAGLGLYVVKETISKLGGKISIDSEVETGTTVEIDIPFGSRSTK
ncbi:MAG: HAMP domain-containing sensor histidine kinase, partial [Cyclobacteriaceae bacterium]